MNANFNGSVTSVAGETVTITVTRPDSTTETLTTLTLADQTFSVSKAYVDAGTYTAKAHMNASQQYQAWDSVERTFSISLTARTGTFNVTLT